MVKFMMKVGKKIGRKQMNKNFVGYPSAFN